MNRIVIFIAGLLLAVSSWGMTEQEAVDLFAGDKMLRHAAAGVAVMRLDSGKIVASHLLDQAIITASTMKTVTSTAALETLGGDFKFETQVLLRGTTSGDTLRGDVVVVGCGDPTLGSRYFPKNPSIVKEITQALKDRGIKVIEGRVLADETIYPYPPYSIHWDVGDLAWDYGAAVFPLNYSDNLATVSFRVDKWGRFTPFTTRPTLSGVQVVNRMRYNASQENVDFALEYATPALVLMGPVCPGSYNLTFANPNPSQLLIDSVAHTLTRAGIRVVGREDVFSHSGRPASEILLTHYSPVLTDIITSLLDRSDNMFTHALLRAVAVRDKAWNGSGDLDKTGVECVKRLLKTHGIDSDGLFMRDGSGLARAGKATPHLLVQMLAFMANRKYNDKRLADLMPQAGNRIGTLLPASSLSKDIVLKSGSMTDVQCFVGYYPADEPQYAFAVLVNNYDCQRKELKNHIDRLLINLFGKKK